jgi:hypothetical protein
LARLGASVLVRIEGHDLIGLQAAGGKHAADDGPAHVAESCDREPYGHAYTVSRWSR